MSTQLFDHQTKGVEFIVKNGGVGALFWDVGVGKTLAALECYRALSQHQKLQLLVVCPINLIECAWIEDIKKFTSFSYENLRVSQYLTNDILLINYEALLSKKFRPTLCKIMRDLNIMCVVDESQKIKSYSAKITKLMLQMSKDITYKILLSATPAPNNETEYWSQMCFLGENILGKNFFAFRNRFFALIRGKAIVPLAGLGKREMIVMMQRGYELKIRPDSKRLLMERIQPYAQVISKRDVLDLPEEIDVIRYVTMTPDQKKAHEELYRDMVTVIKEEDVEVSNALSKIMKVRQVTGGFAYHNEKTLEFSKNPKMEELHEIIEEIGHKKIIVFCQFKWEINAIGTYYSGRAYTLYGDTVDKDSTIQSFKENQSGILCAHPLSAGVGLSFNDCDYMIFYSMDHSFMNYFQCRGRIMRAKKKNKATYIHILAKDSIDMTIYSVVKNKETNHELFRKLLNEKI